MATNMYLVARHKPHVGTDVKEVVFWRRSSAIHSWFANNIPGKIEHGEDYYISAKELSNLRYLCATVIEDSSKAFTYLPPTSFFFGRRTTIDQAYIDDLTHTKVKLDHVLRQPELVKDYEFYYRITR